MFRVEGVTSTKCLGDGRWKGLGVVAPGTSGRMVFTFDKISLVKGQVFRVYFYEKGGVRNMVMTLHMRDVNEARRMN